MIPNGHFHKKWQRRVKTWFDQPMKKLRRKILRARKLTKAAPGPVQLLRPMVQCPTVRYNKKSRVGRGFTLQELKRAGLNAKYARTVGIAVDHRRKNRCLESLERNVQRLREYKERLVVFPVNAKQVVKTDDGKSLNKVRPAQTRVKIRSVTDEEKKFQAYVTLRRARCDAKYAGVRIKRKQIKSDALDGKTGN
jgi:large subunit ribosomal protein L13e